MVIIAFSVNLHCRSATYALAKRAHAIERAGYKGGIFVHLGTGMSSAIYCDAANSTDNRENDPRYPVWRGGLDVYLGNQ